MYIYIHYIYVYMYIYNNLHYVRIDISGSFPATLPRVELVMVMYCLSLCPQRTTHPTAMLYILYTNRFSMYIYIYGAFLK